LEFTPYHVEPGEELPLGTDPINISIGKVTIGNVIISKVIYQIPDMIPAPLFEGEYINVFIPESVYAQWLAQHEAQFLDRTETLYMVNTAAPDVFTEKATALFEQHPTVSDERRVIQNISQITRLNRNLTLIIMMFGYGFIAMLSLISVTSVVATITTAMALRRQEFAMLFSVGMTRAGMDKMLNLESLLYGLKSLMIGLPVSLALSFLIHQAIIHVLVFAYRPPITAMVISAAAVMALTFATMRYGKRKLQNISIIEAIRDESV